MFGHLVPTKLARDILGKLVSSGDVQVYACGGPSGAGDSKQALDPDSQDVLCALDDACEDARSSRDRIGVGGREKQPKGKEKARGGGEFILVEMEGLPSQAHPRR